ncbi:MAG: hypothetical protein KME28_19775 [Pelatocladus maniniholoensis HA4357-MV3]|jgi:hypothetical protein|uniref:Uncharacterized protein n=1 Tax=Pelatocladus maniniholoensis HA4357-MV3 TaxID=1117104 RepID=A0A9E3HA63_9NOST|nr:hypothetical protein [Pelatocladus maniniholoensis HA4357-MV3]
MKKIIFLSIPLSFLIILPAMADIGQVWTDFQSYATDLQNYLRNNLTETLQPLESETQSAIDSSTGELNIPNPNAAGEIIRDGTIWYYTSGDKFDNNSTVRANLVSNEINRLITRGAASGLLGTNGQLRLKTKLEETERTLEEIAKSSEETDQESQDLLDQATALIPEDAKDPINKILAILGANQGILQQQGIRIQREDLKISGENLSQTIQTNQFLQYSNLNLTNISQQVEENNRARRVDNSTEASRLLRNTSQVDLFGRAFEQ